VAEKHAAVQQELALVSERISQMETDMTTLKAKLASAKLKLKGLQVKPSTNRSSGPNSNVALSPSEKRVQRAFGRFDRLQTQVENLEARVRSYEVGGPSPEVWEKELVAADPAVEQELQQMKQRLDEENTEAAA
jgi:phage shock protein A